MKELTLEKAVELHRALWTWLGWHPDKDEKDWPRWGEIEAEYGEIINDCFMCAYNTSEECMECPLDWTDEGRYSGPICSSYIDDEEYTGLYTMYRIYRNCGNESGTSGIAHIIANLPLKEEYRSKI